MKTALWVSGLLIFLQALPLRADITYGGGDGSSEARAIVIQGAKDDFASTHSEYDYLAKHYPSYHVSMQSLINREKNDYDKLEFTTPDGLKHAIYFDITVTFRALNGMLKTSANTNAAPAQK